VSFGTKGKILATFSSTAEGTLCTESKGHNGFGYDPIFIPMWSNKTFGQMELREKSVYSHRSKALQKLALWYLNAEKNNTLEENAIIVGASPDEREKISR
jgi:non-canonical purine NTP pyrophosphatase (RdgB/HAM1 family)